MKKLLHVYQSSNTHWVGDGFPIRSVFDYNGLGKDLSPFLLLDYVAPYRFPPTNKRRGVGAHPHKGLSSENNVVSGISVRYRARWLLICRFLARAG